MSFSKPITEKKNEYRSVIRSDSKLVILYLACSTLFLKQFLKEGTIDTLPAGGCYWYLPSLCKVGCAKVVFWAICLPLVLIIPHSIKWSYFILVFHNIICYRNAKLSWLQNALWKFSNQFQIQTVLYLVFFFFLNWRMSWNIER